MSGTAESFPAHLWYQSIPQAERQLLLLQQYNINPKISAYAYVYEMHGYNTAPFVTIGMEKLIHYKPKIRGTFAENFSKVFVLGTEFQHYRSRITWMKDTRATRISDTVFHKNKYITNTDITPKDQVIADNINLADAIKGRMPTHLI